MDKPDSSKIKILNDLCWNNRSDNPGFAFLCGKEALQLGITLGSQPLMTRTYNLLGVVCRELGYYDKALAYLHNALMTAKEINDPIEIGFSENNIGSAYRLKGYYAIAMQHILRGLQEFESVQYQYGIAYSCITIGYVYTDQRNIEKAKLYLDSSYHIRQSIGDTAGMGNSLREIARLYTISGDFPNALQTFEEAKKIFTISRNKGGLINTTVETADMYLAQKKYSDALPLYLSAYETVCEANILRTQFTCAVKLGIVYAHLSKFKEADHYLREARRLSGSIDEYSIMFTLYGAYSEFYELSGNLKESIKYWKLYSSLKDSIMSRESISGVHEMEAMYDYEKVKSENALLQKTIELSRTQRDYGIIIAALALALAILLYFRNRYQKKAEEKIRRINTELQALITTRDKFFSIIAHDLRSPFQGLLGLSGLLAEESEQLPPGKLNRFSQELHQGIRKQFDLLSDLLEWAKLQKGDMKLERQVINAADEVQYVVDAQMVPLKLKKIAVDIAVGADLTLSADRNMLRLVLRNLLSNSIKFTHAQGNIRIAAEQKGSVVEFMISDDGVGISEDNLSKLFQNEERSSANGTAGETGTGLGLLLCKEIVEKHGGLIWAESEMNKNSSFFFTLPIAS